MNCGQFAENWNQHVLGNLEARDESQMLEHSRACDACGTRWREQEELSVLLGSVISPLKPSDDAAVRLVGRLPAAQLDRPTSTEQRFSSVQPFPVHSGPLLLAAFLGGMAMYVMLGTGVGSSRMEQLAYAEMFSRGVGRGGLSVLALGATDFVGLLISLAFILWITRASFWEVLFPIRLPRSLLLARWLAIPTIMIGGLRVLLLMWILITSWTTPMLQSRAADMSVWGGTSHLLDQIWKLGFWLTILILLFGVLNEITARYARPLQ